MNNDKLYFDIETIPSQESWVKEHIEGKVKPPATIKKPESLEKWMNENREAAIQEALDKTSFSGATNHIVTIAWAINDEPVYSVQVDSELSEEPFALQEFFTSIEKLKMGSVFVGHNILGFDINVIKQRAMVLGVKIPRIFPIDAKPWGTEVYDTMLKWDSRNFVGIDLISKAFGIKGKGEVDGSMVYPMWQEGRYAEIAAYCEDDVRMSREVYKRMTFGN